MCVWIEGLLSSSTQPALHGASMRKNYSEKTHRNTKQPAAKSAFSPFLLMLSGERGGVPKQ
jgi:hypothetical protein